ncbi:MAG TPA: hypothetical protein VKZ44_05405 [Taishania sp.]|nr:hypothetical protein [Taishania sp.]
MTQLDFEQIQLMKRSYDVNGVKYSIYNENNRFHGTPIPEGYEAVYIPKDEWGIPDSLQLKRKTDEKLESK